MILVTKVLEQRTGQTPVFSKARYTIRTLGIRRNEKIAQSMWPTQKKFKRKKNNFSDAGNFGFGIQEHIDLGIKYDLSFGIRGLYPYMVLSRPGFNTADDKHRTGCIGTKQN
ncbi:hypothetical protein GH733_002813 [Mirounga leonina]|nr:hypothetical protein GH733_002813 [Mirounga leonina]